MAHARYNNFMYLLLMLFCIYGGVESNLSMCTVFGVGGLHVCLCLDNPCYVCCRLSLMWLSNIPFPVLMSLPTFTTLSSCLFPAEYAAVQSLWRGANP